MHLYWIPGVDRSVGGIEGLYNVVEHQQLSLWVLSTHFMSASRYGSRRPPHRSTHYREAESFNKYMLQQCCCHHTHFLHLCHTEGANSLKV